MRLAVQYFQLHGIFLTRFYDSYVFITSVIVNESNIIENKWISLYDTDYNTVISE